MLNRRLTEKVDEVGAAAQLEEHHGRRVGPQSFVGDLQRLGSRTHPKKGRA